jgi:hypothetical protein
MKQLIITLIACCLSLATYAQRNDCLSLKSGNQQNQAATLKEQLLNNEAYLKLLAGENRTAGGPLIIPIVFHVVHMNGAENIPDSLILIELDSLNAYYSNSYQFTNPNSVNTNIQFCLASVDPYGNPTTGITHDTSSFTVMANYAGDVLMKNVNRWNPLRYLNVWFCKDVLNAAGAGAYSSFPWSMGEPSDGIVIMSMSIALGGGNHTLLSHEVGHYLGLYHLMDGDSCKNENCLLDGDKVCDTPPQYFNNYDCNVSSCSSDMDDTTGLSPFTSDVADGSNIMTPRNNCALIDLTQGQSDRMNYFLLNVRNQLLESNGCGSNVLSLPAPIAGFTTSAIGCYYQQFCSTAINTEYTEWDFNNDGVIDGAGDTVLYRYPQSGYYTIVQRVFNGSGWDTDTLTTFIHVRPNGLWPIVSQTGITYMGVCKGTSVSFTAAPGMVSYLWENGDTTQTTTFIADSTFQMGITCVDTMGNTWTRCPDPLVTYTVNDFPQAPVLTASDDSVCRGDTIAVYYQLAPNTSVVGWWINTHQGIMNQNPVVLYTANQSYWQVAMLVTDSTTCRTLSDTTFLYADPIISSPYTPGVLDSVIYGATQWHNQYYLNGMPLTAPDSNAYVMTQPGCYSILSWKELMDCAVMSDTICYGLTVGLTENQTITNGIAYPNPSQGIITLQLLTDLSNDQMNQLLGSITIFNALGQTISAKTSSTSPKTISIDLRGSTSGMYIVNMGEKEVKVFFEKGF